jgi:hypothetical protein
MSVFLLFILGFVEAKGADNFNAGLRLYGFLLGLLYDISILKILFNL